MKVLEVQSYTSSLHLPHYCPLCRLPQGWPEWLTGPSYSPSSRGQKSCCVSFDCKGKEDNYPLHLQSSRDVLYLWPSFVSTSGKLTSLLKLIPTTTQNGKMTFRIWATF